MPAVLTELMCRMAAVQTVKKLKDESYQLDRIRRLSRLRENLQTAVSGSSDASRASAAPRHAFACD